jgi:pSer/pThr/pTyr-binding forkhead associated (FHA) protein
MSAGRLFWVQRDATVVEIPLTKLRVVIGRSQDADVRIQKPSISGKHAAIVLRDSTTVIEDTRSTNGVRVNGKKIASIALKHGDQIELGSERMVYFTDSGQPPASFGRSVSLADIASGTVVVPEALDAVTQRQKRDVSAPTYAPTPAPTTRSKDDGPRAPELRASVVLLSGSNNGRRFPVSKEVTTLGQEGMQVFQLVLRDGEYWAMRGPASAAPMVNGITVDDRGMRLKHGDEVELAGAKVRFELEMSK